MGDTEAIAAARVNFLNDQADADLSGVCCFLNILNLHFGVGKEQGKSQPWGENVKILSGSFFQNFLRVEIGCCSSWANWSPGGKVSPSTIPFRCTKTISIPA